MSAQLDQILSYLDKEGVTEIMIGMGQPASLRRRGQLIKITGTPVTRKQLDILLQGTTLAAYIPEKDGVTPRSDVQVGARMVRTIVSRRGDEIILRIEKSPAGATVTRPPARTAPPPPLVTPTQTSVISVIPTQTQVISVLPTQAPIDLELDEPVARPRTSTKSPKPRTKTGQTKAPESRTKSKRIPRVDHPSGGPIDPSLTIGGEFDLELPQAAPAQRPSFVAEPAQRPSFVAEPAQRPSFVAEPAQRPSFAPAPASHAPIHAARPPSPARSGAFAALLDAAIARGATDLHIASGRITSMRVLGDLIPVDASGPRSHADVEAILLPLLDAKQQEQLAHKGYVDLALASPSGGRLRTNISRAQGGIKGTFRIARSEPATLDELGLPKELAKVVNHHQGLVVVSGPSGHGKTTTLSALVDLVNAARPHHIITVEDPIEIVYPRKAAVVSQREVGPHTKSFAAALKGSLREDPDVIVIGELRDRETVEIALTASETGHLVLATMSTPSAAKTIDRLVDMFPPEDQQQVRASIAGALRAIVSQRLLPRTDGQGVVAAIELVTGVLPLAAMIRDDKLYQLPSLLQRGKAFGMIRMDDTLVELVRANRITAETALQMTDNKRELAAMLRGAGATQGLPKIEEPAATPTGKSRIAGLFGLGGKKES